MVAPLAVYGALAVGSAVTQWLSSRAGQAASEEERARMAELLNQVQEPDFDTSQFTPEQYELVKEYVPQVAKFVEAAAPEMVKLTESGSRGRDAELSALAELQSIARSGTDPLTEIARNQSARRASADSHSNRATIDEQMQRRGLQQGSGLGLAANLLGTSSAFQNDALAGEQAAIANAQRRDSALQNAGQLGGNIYGQDVNLQSKNADILNQFNQWATNRRQDFNNSNANVYNEAQRFNIGNQQDISNRNIGNKNDAFKYNQGLRNQSAQQKYNNAMSKVTGQQANSAGVIGDIQARTAQNNTAIQGLANAGMAAAQYGQSRQDRSDDIAREEDYRRKRLERGF
jgi:hypothetical protein